MKRKAISKKFINNSVLVSLVIILLGYFTLNTYKKTIDEEVYKNTKNELFTTYNEYIKSKKDIGITNAFSISNDGLIKESLQNNKRELAINSLKNINAILKNGTSFKNVKIHIHTNENKSFLRNWKENKYGDDLSSFRKSIVTVNNAKQPVNGYEVGKAGLSLRSVVPIISNNQHLGSLEFIQGLNSVAKAFDKSDEGFYCLWILNIKFLNPNQIKFFRMII